VKNSFVVSCFDSRDNLSHDRRCSLRTHRALAAQQVHRENFDPNAVQVSTLLSIKTGACPEDCAYCPQSIRYQTGVDTHDLMPLDEVRAAARRAKDAGATRFCMGASYRGPKDAQLEPILVASLAKKRDWSAAIRLGIG